MRGDKISALLNDDRYESKDWKQADLLGRIEWLIFMLEAKNEEVDKWVSIINNNLVPIALEKAVSDDLDEPDTRDATPEEETMLGTIMAQEGRIEALEATLKTMIDPQVSENMVRVAEPMLSDALAAADKRIEALEAKLAKAVDFVLRSIRYAGNSGDDFLADKARATLAELKGDQL